MRPSILRPSNEGERRVRTGLYSTPCLPRTCSHTVCAQKRIGRQPSDPAQKGPCFKITLPRENGKMTNQAARSWRLVDADRAKNNMCDWAWPVSIFRSDRGRFSRQHRLLVRPGPERGRRLQVQAGQCFKPGQARLRRRRRLGPRRGWRRPFLSPHLPSLPLLGRGPAVLPRLRLLPSLAPPAPGTALPPPLLGPQLLPLFAYLPQRSVQAA